MSKVINEHIHALHLLAKTSSIHISKTILKYSDENLIKAITELFYNLLNNKSLIVKLSYDKKFAANIADRKITISRKRKILLSHKGRNLLRKILPKILLYISSI